MHGVVHAVCLFVLPFVFGERGTSVMRTALSFAKTSSFVKRIYIFYLLKGISCKHDYSAFKKYTLFFNTNKLNKNIEAEIARKIRTI